MFPVESSAIGSSASSSPQIKRLKKKTQPRVSSLKVSHHSTSTNKYSAISNLRMNVGGMPHQ